MAGLGGKPRRLPLRKVFGIAALAALVGFFTYSQAVAVPELPPLKNDLKGGGQSAAVSRIVEAVLAAPPRSQPYKVSVCTVIKDEGRYLAEWVIYHFLLGFDHFILYDNESTDNTRAVLQPFIDRGWVTYIEWPTAPGGDMWAHQSTQLEHCFHNPKNYRDTTEWMGAFDIDEFVAVVGNYLTPEPFAQKAPFQLHVLLDNLRGADCGGTIMDRVVFGTSGHATPPKELLISEYTKRSVVRLYPHLEGKPLIYFEGFKQLEGGLNFTAKEGFSPCLADCSIWENQDEVKHRVYEPFRLHHYVTRSYEECLAKLKPEYNAKAKTKTWRSENGVAFCNLSMPGTPQYNQFEWVDDRLLVDSLFPAVIRELLLELK